MDTINGNSENKKIELTIAKFDYSITFVFIAPLLMVTFLLITNINISAWKLSSYK